MAEFGTLSLYALMLLSVWSGALALVGGRRRQPELVHAARRLLYAAAALSTAAVLVLTFTFAVSDFGVVYVQRYSDRTMPVFYRLTAVWGGQEGSLLIWAWLLSVMSAWSVHINQERLRELMPHIVLVLTLVLDFFCVLLLLVANPFDAFLVEQPAAGQGLNPLLQNPYMVTHPPALYIGYVGMVIPFAFAMGSLLSGHTDESWIRAARPWLLGSWYFLTLGLVLGMVWAYEELGWGGFWGWDPVENAGLFPWLTATALTHSFMVQERRGTLKVWNIVLAVLTFALTIFGTFLTRSGFIQSVHAFARSSIGWYFLGFLALVALSALVLVIWRWGRLRSGAPPAATLSRESFIVLTNWVLVVITLAVMVLTIFPTLSQLFGNKISIAAPAFNLWMTPPGLVLLAMTAICPSLGWQTTTLRTAMRELAWPVGLAAAVLLLAVALGLRPAEPTALQIPDGLRSVWSVLPLVTFGLSTMVLAQLTREIARGVLGKTRSSGAAVARHLARSRRRYGAGVVHLGMGLLFLGFAGEAYKLEQQVQLKRGQRVTVGDYTLRYDGIRQQADRQKQMLTATLTVFDTAGKRIGAVEPARWIYFKHQNQPTSEVDIRHTLREDLFVVLADFDARGHSASFKVIVNRLVNWMWIGFLVLTVGAAITLAPSLQRKGASSASPRAAPARGRLGALLHLGLPAVFAASVGAMGLVRGIPGVALALGVLIAAALGNTVGFALGGALSLPRWLPGRRPMSRRRRQVLQRDLLGLQRTLEQVEQQLEQGRLDGLQARARRQALEARIRRLELELADEPQDQFKQQLEQELSRRAAAQQGETA